MVLSGTLDGLLIGFTFFVFKAKSYIVRKIVSEIMGDINGLEYVHVNDIIKLLNTGTTGKKFIIGNKFEVIIEKKDKATFVKK